MTKPVLVLPENTKGRDFVVGDIHGVFSLLDQALKDVKFDPARDRLIAVGDLIDRGPESGKALEYLAQPWFYTVRGNHEVMFSHFIKDGKVDQAAVAINVKNGMGWIMDEEIEKLEKMKAAFEQLPIAIEVQTKNGPVGFVHADIPKGMDWDTFKKHLETGEKKTIQTALWGRSRILDGNDEGVKGAHRVYFGHTPVTTGVRQLGNCFFMDTGGVFRVMYGEVAFKFFLAVSDIQAEPQDMLGKPPLGQHFKTATARPPKDKPPTAKPPKPPKRG